MSRLLAAIYALVAYVLFLVSVLYAIGFTGNLIVPKTIDGGPPGALGPALAIDLALLGLFAVQHSVMARPAFKRRWTRIVPPAIERSTYVLFASLALLLLYALWQPLPAPVWRLTGVAAGAMTAVFWLGWATVFLSTFMISHFELFGLRQVWLHWRGEAEQPTAFRTPFLYGFVRHPIYLGFVMAFWGAAAMSQGHLLFAAATTAYILIAIQLEERDLIATFGADYHTYRARVGMLIPRPRTRG